MADIYQEAAESIVNADRAGAEEIAQRALDSGIAPADIMQNGFVKGIQEVGDLFESGEVFLPELMMSADAMAGATANSLGPPAAIQIRPDRRSVPAPELCAEPHRGRQRPTRRDAGRFGERHQRRQRDYLGLAQSRRRRQPTGAPGHPARLQRPECHQRAVELGAAQRARLGRQLRQVRAPHRCQRQGVSGHVLKSAERLWPVAATASGRCRARARM